MARIAGGTYPTKTYSHSELEELWVAAGGPPASKNLMAAIAEAESSGRSWAIEPKNGCTGLWQICPGGSQYLDPQKNAEEAVYKFTHYGIGQWETWTNGSYASFLVGNKNISTKGQPTKTITKGAGPEEKTNAPEHEGAEGGIIPTLTPVPEISAFLHKFKSWTDEMKAILGFLLSREGWVRILEIVAGLGLLFIAVKELFHIETPSVAPVPIPV